MIEGPAGLASRRWSCLYEDALGRAICETRPGFRGALLVTSNEYNAANQLVATRSYSLDENSTPNDSGAVDRRSVVLIYYGLEAPVVKLAHTLDSGSSAARLVGSSPTRCTKKLAPSSIG